MVKLSRCHLLFKSYNRPVSFDEQLLGDLSMSELSIGLLIDSERQRIKRRCCEIDDQFDALGEERQALMTVGEALASVGDLRIQGTH